MGRPVAIKEYFPEGIARREKDQVVCLKKQEKFFAKSLESFRKEGHTLSLLSHPNVVQVLDLFLQNGTAYLVMKLIKGESLRHVWSESGEKLELLYLEKIIGQMVEALASIHAQGICHLDLKPENVMLDSGTVILVDFGAARQYRDERSASKMALAYAPPEVLLMDKGEVGPESDIYELAVVIYEMLVGRRPPSALERLTTAASWKPGSELES
jgi:serine/threonine protein kinase